MLQVNNFLRSGLKKINKQSFYCFIFAKPKAKIMKIKEKHLMYLYIIVALLVIFTGTLFKINHLPYANILLISGLALEALAIILLMIKQKKIRQ